MKEKAGQIWPMYSKIWSCHKTSTNRPRRYKQDSIESSICDSQKGGGNKPQRYPSTVKKIVDADNRHAKLKHFFNSLTAMVAYMQPLFIELHHCLITFRIFVRSQHLIASRNVTNGFLLNCGVSHCYEACPI
jgi:hypothetical protein